MANFFPNLQDSFDKEYKTNSSFFEAYKTEVFLCLCFLLFLFCTYVVFIQQPNEDISYLSIVSWTLCSFIDYDSQQINVAELPILSQISIICLTFLKILVIAVIFGYVREIISDILTYRKYKKIASVIEKRFQEINYKVNTSVNKQRKILFFPLRKMTVVDLSMDLSISEEDVIKAVKTSKKLRIKNLALAQDNDCMPDKLFVDFIEGKVSEFTKYGICVNRSSNVTIVCPKGFSCAGLSFFAWHLAQLGGFNYVGNEYYRDNTINEKYRCNFFTIHEDINTNYDGFKQYLDDIHKFTQNTSTEPWCIVINGIYNHLNYDSDFDLYVGGKKDKDTNLIDVQNPTINNITAMQNFYNEFSQSTVEKDNVNIKATLHTVFAPMDNSNAKVINIARRLHNDNKKINAVIVSIPYSILVFDKSPNVHNCIRLWAELLNKYFDGNKPIITENYTREHFKKMRGY